ncbi:MAG: DAK2 domain-containing protein [Anaerolineae bacterium]|nr:DAK2 domain-containing protein [Anaerolineae bacterium]
MSSQFITSTTGVVEVNGQDFKLLVHAGLSWLKVNQQIVNALNVFPVPDGDTGTNMVLTMQAAYDEVKNSTETNLGKMAHDIAQGALMGARGNSGVILSQLWRGFARAMDSNETMTQTDLVSGLIEAKNTAYKGVVRPVEGTILTVAKDIAAAAEENIKDELPVDDILKILLEAAARSVENTPNLLPILKQAKVVDSGGKGLYYIFEGMAKFLRGESLEKSEVEVTPIAAMEMEDTMETIEPGQDFEVVIDFRPHDAFNLQTYYNELEQIGTSIQVGEGDNLYRMHIHVPSENRYTPIDFTMSFGTITKVYIENLMDQMQQKSQSTNLKEPPLALSPIEPGQIAVVAASPGAGISQIFASLGVAAIVKGGQTMNPSTEEIIGSFADLPTDQIIILPNNKNIILAAQAAASMVDKKVAVIPCKTVPQGISALLRLMPGMDFETVVEDMINACDDVDTGEVTIATRTVEINGVHVQEGQVIALHNGKLIRSCIDVSDATMSILADCNMDERERITFFCGGGITEDQVNMVVTKVESQYPEHEVEIHDGGQPFYQFIIAIE